MKNDDIVGVTGSGGIIGCLDSGQGGGGGGDIGSVLSIHDGIAVQVECGRGIKVFLSRGAQGSGGGDDAVDSGITTQNHRRDYVRAEKIVVEDVGVSAERDALGRCANFIRDEEIPLVECGGACNGKSGSIALAKVVGDFAPGDVAHADARECVEFGLVVDQRCVRTGFKKDSVCVVVAKIIEAGGLGGGRKVDSSRCCRL